MSDVLGAKCGAVGGAPVPKTIKSSLDDSLAGLNELEQKLERLCEAIGFFEECNKATDAKVRQDSLTATVDYISLCVSRLHSIANRLNKIV